MRFKERPPEKSEHLAPPISEEPPLQSQKPIFNFRYLVKKKCLCKCNPEQRIALHNKLDTLSKITWAQIEVTGRRQNGAEYIDQLNARLPKQAPEGARAMVFRFHGVRMVGYRDGREYYLVQIDTKLNSYKH